ncbi:PBP1A family penicillin-binding protein [Candidatus Poribacteria bacterium]|nr:PBP1A family penicillin-binding protein [Candidatus Poribacteria bacterium]
MKHILKIILQVFLSIIFTCILVVFLIVCFGIGVAGGFTLGCWEDVVALDMEKLKYTEDTKTWRQHTEIYSSVCEVQRKDTTRFLIDKLQRLDYEMKESADSGVSAQGQYSINLTGTQGKQNGSIQVFLREFKYPNMDEETKAKRVNLTIKEGKIEFIQDGAGNRLRKFFLEPELIDEFADTDTGSTRTIIPLVEMPENLVNAFIAIEDHRFYQHFGIDVIRLIGAMRDALLRRSVPEGTSTLTQQLTRNIYLGDDSTIVRKVREMLLSFRIEKQLSKSQILEGYLNFIDLGRFGSQTLYGVQKASKAYFDKEVSELEIDECALLAAIPKATTGYSPITNPENAKKRRNVILNAMHKNGWITPQEYLLNRKKPIAVQSSTNTLLRQRYYTAGHFIDYIQSLLKDIPELENSIYKEGLKVYTTIDMSMQFVAMKAVENHLLQLDKSTRLPNYITNKDNPKGIDPIRNYLQAGLISIDPKTGHVKAMVGGRDYFITNKRKPGINSFNRTIGTKSQPSRRQPGSAFKPIVFAALLQEPSLISPASIFVDEPWEIEHVIGQKWKPRNYSMIFKGPVSLRNILKRSINIPTAKAAWNTPDTTDGYKEGIVRTIELSKKMGIKTPMDPAKPALTLGAFGMTILELTSAYGAFVNRGIIAEPVFIQYVTDAKGTPIYPLPSYQQKRTQVLDERIAYQITSFLESVINAGTGIRAISTDHPYQITRPIAGKTGTTNENVDAWFVGYSTDLVTGVWVGLDKQRRGLRNYNEEGAKAALPIWARFMKDASRGPEKPFPVPEGIEFWEIDNTTGLLKNKDKCPPENISMEPFLVEQVPSKICDRH